MKQLLKPSLRTSSGSGCFSCGGWRVCSKCGHLPDSSCTGRRQCSGGTTSSSGCTTCCESCSTVSEAIQQLYEKRRHLPVVRLGNTSEAPIPPLPCCLICLSSIWPVQFNARLVVLQNGRETSRARAWTVPCGLPETYVCSSETQAAGVQSAGRPFLHPGHKASGRTWPEGCRLLSWPGQVARQPHQREQWLHPRTCP